MRNASLRWLGLATLLLSSPFLVAPDAGAQAPINNPLYAFELEIPQPQVTVGFGQSVPVGFIFRDLSKDGSPNPSLPTPSLVPLMHTVTFSLEPLEADTGWQAIAPPQKFTVAGQVLEDSVLLQAQASAANPFYILAFTATVTTNDGGKYVYNATIVGYSPGVTAFNVLPPPAVQLKPQETANLPIRVYNGALLPRTFSLETVSASCGLLVAAPAIFTVPAKTQTEVRVTIESPSAKPYYLGDQCQAQFLIGPEGSRDAGLTVTATIQVDGAYVNPVWIFWLVAAILLILLLVLLIARRKARIEEEILGKPQKPWTIPVEVLYLKALRQKDERAWYVVRHHLMEEEYRSALLWYHSYKKATKGARQKESLVLRQEKAYARWKASWQKEIAKPLKQADRFEAKLQRKLDRKAAKQERKVARKVRKITRKMAAAHAKQVERALEKWQKQVKKADKKGLAAPPRPSIPEPDYPEEPEVESTPLAQHKWSKKAARFRARSVRKQGDLEVKFEKADARRLAKLQRKVQRLARKLDDPTFVAEHPLLKSDA